MLGRAKWSCDLNRIFAAVKHNLTGTLNKFFSAFRLAELSERLKSSVAEVRVLKQPRVHCGIDDTSVPFRITFGDAD